MKLDLNLLKRLLVIDHPSKKEWPMISFIINECYKIGGLEFEVDHYSNIFITKNTTNPTYYPCVVAHMDCVLPHTNKQVKIKHGKIFGKNSVSGKQIGLGMDDANGICCAIQLLKEVSDLKVCFTTEEEIGFWGASEAAENIDFFCDVSYMIQADRRGSSDLITYTNGIHSASEDWLKEITGLMAKYSYSEEYGIGTDIGELASKLQLSGVNISCGYMKEHTNQEYTVIKDLENCLNFMLEILKTVPIDKQYEIKAEPYSYYYHPTSSTLKSKYSYYDDYPVDDSFVSPCANCMDFDCMNCTKVQCY